MTGLVRGDEHHDAAHRFLTPPVGLLSFVTSSATGVSLDKVYRGVTPFWITLIVANALVIVFPEIALFLPQLMRAR